MANTITNLVPDLYEALDVVSREVVGMVAAVSRDSNAERAALNQTVRSFVTSAGSTSNITPGQLAPDDGDQTIGNVTLSISKSKYYPVRWNGEEQKGLNTGPGYSNVLRDQFAQAMRVLVNEVEADLTALYVSASRAVSPTGSILFDGTGATTYADLAKVRKVLVDNGAPLSDMNAVLSTTAGAQFRSNGLYLSADSSGDTTMLRQGVLLDMHGIAIRESAQIKTHTAGTGSGLKTDSTGYAVGATSIVVDTDGSGTLVAGDIITFSTDATASKYVVATGGDMGAGGTVIIAAPGLRGSLAASQADITVVAEPERNMVFARSAIHLVTRAPATPVEGDSAADSIIIQDEKSGLAFEVTMYKEYKRIKFEVALAWGVKVIKPEHLALLVE